MIRGCLFAVPVAVLLLSGAGCIVTRTSYELKARETDSLRSALGALNREKSQLEEENAALSKRVAEGKEAEAALSKQVKEMDESLKRLGEGLTGSRQPYNGTRITRDRFIDELLERERATGRRIQELTARAEGYEKDLDRMRREAAAREAEVADLGNKLSVLASREEQLLRERAILSGRVERIREERTGSSLRREETFSLLSAGLAKVSTEIDVTPLGPVLRIVVPERLVVGERGGNLTKTGASIVSKVSHAVSDLPHASLLVIAGGKAAAEAVRAAADGRIPRDRLLSHVREKGRTAEFLLIAQ